MRAEIDMQARVFKRRVLGRIAPLLFGAALLPTGGAQAQTTSVCEQPNPIPCTDPRGCPDLIIDADFLPEWFVENRRFPKRNCSVLEGEVLAGARTLLRFWSATPNIGPGDLAIGVPTDEWFVLDTCHGHYHLKEYTDYRLWTKLGYAAWQNLRAANPGACPGDLLLAHPEISSQMVAGRKQGFCVIDLFPYHKAPCPTDTVLPDKYFDCFGEQGLSVCWTDAYDPGLPGQWIDVTDLPDGDYVLELEVNAERLFTEANYDNNTGAIDIPLVKPVRRGGGHR